MEKVDLKALEEEKSYLDKCRDIIRSQVDVKYHWETKSEMDDVERAKSR